MNPVSPSRRRALRLAAAATVALFLALVLRFWHPVYGLTSFYQLDAPNDDLKIAAFRALPVYVHRHTGGYDGLYYAQIAHDPLLRGGELPRAMDNLPYRARRILPPALAWLAGAGQSAWIIHTYAWLNIAAWLALAAILWRLLAVQDARGWLAWAGVLFSAGALGSVRLALTDLVALTVIAGALLALERGRKRSGLAGLALAGLARETSLLAIVGTVHAPWFSWRNAARLLLAAAPLATWLAYVRWAAGPADAGWSNFTLPLVGLVEKWIAAMGALFSVADKPLAWTTLLATAALTVQAVFFAVRRNPADPWWRIGAGYAGLMLCLGTAVWEGFPGAATRVLLPLNLAFNVLALRSRVPLAWLVAGNLTVFAGLLSVRDVPQDPHEIAASRIGGTSAVVRTGAGWFDHEQSRRHRWQWARARGELTVERWARGGRPLQIEFSLRSLAPRTVVIRHEGREIFQAAAGPAFTHHQVALPAAMARTITLEFATAEPPVLENAAPGARELGFALYDLRLAPAPP
ncbi:MAG: hypothetical protein JNK23_17255 [Opitutaceae bacterium]|nr:hypothetical protein [Opitutaceae bacterium]